MLISLAIHIQVLVFEPRCDKKKLIYDRSTTLTHYLLNNAERVVYRYHGRPQAWARGGTCSPLEEVYKASFASIETF